MGTRPGASSIACVLERVPRAMPVGIYGLELKIWHKELKTRLDDFRKGLNAILDKVLKARTYQYSATIDTTYGGLLQESDCKFGD